MRVVFLGTPEFAVPTLNSLIEHPQITVAGVVTQPDRRRGRGSKLIPSPVKKIALEHNLPVWQPSRIKKDTTTLEKLQETQADVFVVVAYGQILSPAILAMPRQGCINVHGSILPQYRGAAPIQWSIYNGDRQTGITTMLMDAGMDTGDMLLKAYTPIGLFDNAQQIATKLAKQGGDLLLETLFHLPDISPLPQENSAATYAPLIEKSHYLLDWEKSAIALHNQVRGFFPNCYTTWRGQTLKVIATAPLAEEYLSDLPQPLAKLTSGLSSLVGNPGEVVSIIKNQGPVVATASGFLLLQEVQVAGKRPQSGHNFVNGMRLSIGEKLQ